MKTIVGMFLVTAVMTGHSAVPTVDGLENRIARRDLELDAEWRTIADAARLEDRCARFRTALRQACGTPDIVRSPLNARTTGTRDFGAFRLEKVLLESAPGMFVSALVFLPDATKFAPPYAGFMFIPGHADGGKSWADYLHTCELGARNGLAVVTYDPLGQGERSQGAGLRTADEHVRVGAYAALLGETTATYMLRDAARVFDYFEARPDVDATRLGVCGNSGGGTLSALFMVVDDRVRAAAPSCYLSSVREHILACGPQDAEQNFFDEQAWGFNHAALVLSAGCPVLINAAKEDFFQIAGSRATFAVVREVAARIGFPEDRHMLSEAPGKHAMSKVHREQAVRFLLRHLTGVTRTVVETETTELAGKDCRVTPEGEVSKLLGFKSVYDELAEKFVRRNVCVESAAVRAKRQVLAERSGSDCRDVVSTLRGRIERGERACLHVGGETAPDEAGVVLFADGERLVRRRERRGKLSYYERRKDDEVVAVDLYVSGRSLVALRAAELLTVAAELEKRTGRKPRLVAEGRHTVPAKFACAADPAAFAEVVFRNEPRPWIESLRRREYLSFADSGALVSGK